MADTNGFRARIAMKDELWAKMKDELAAQGIERIDIWEGLTPEDPSGRGFRAGLYILPTHQGAPRGMFIICAGGAFLFKSSNEAKPVAEYFHARGYNAAILDYTVNPNAEDAPSHIPTRIAAGNDALRAIRYVRANAEKLNVRPDRIAIGGFSAGGMTSQMAATRYDAGDPSSSDPLMRVSSRPDAVLLLYGAFSGTTSVGGLNFDAKQQNTIAQIDPIRNIRWDCPPMFIFQTNADDPRNALCFAMELAHRGISYEVHTFTNGPHGGALYNGLDDTPKFDHTAKWADLAASWLKEQDF